jgi:zinc/manganese transport system substrate-binding protein
MRPFLVVVLGLAAALSSATACAALDVFACEPEWAALAKELGGDKVSVFQAITAQQDVHRVEARPSLIARARSADLLVCTGAELEISWLPLLLRSAGNRKIQPGQPGNFVAADLVAKIEVPARLDRAEGDVHPYGNPHIHLDPRNVSRIAQALGERLAQLDAANAAHYQARTADFLARWDKAIPTWEAQGAALKGMRVVSHHKDYNYLFRWLGMEGSMSLEPKPGLQPSVAYLGELLGKLQTQPAEAITRSVYSDPKPSGWLSERAKLPVVVLPYTVGGTQEAKDLFGLFEDSIHRLVSVRKAG